MNGLIEMTFVAATFIEENEFNENKRKGKWKGIKKQSTIKESEVICKFDIKMCICIF